MELLIENETVADIVSEVQKFKSVQQAEILAYIRALRMKEENLKPAAKYKRNIKPLSMEEIDRIKHEVRKQYARK